MSTRHSYKETRSTQHVGAVFCHSLKISLMSQCSTRYETKLTVRHGTFASVAGSEEVTFKIGQADEILLSASIAVRFVGGNVYDLIVTPENGRTWQRTYTLSTSQPMSPTRTPCLGDEAAQFILDTLEQRIGRQLLTSGAPPGLRSQSDPGRTSSFLRKRSRRT